MDGLCLGTCGRYWSFGEDKLGETSSHSHIGTAESMWSYGSIPVIHTSPTPIASSAMGQAELMV